MLTTVSLTHSNDVRSDIYQFVIKGSRTDLLFLLERLERLSLEPDDLDCRPLIEAIYKELKRNA